MRIFIIRHGESAANVDESLYAHYQDHNVPLTEFGYEQAVKAGQAIRDYYDTRPDLEGKKPRLWHSTFLRTRQTAQGILKGFGRDRVDAVFADPLLREQDYGIFGNIRDRKILAEKFPEEYKYFQDCCDKKGKFYAVPHAGESVASVVDRMRTFIESRIELNLIAGHEDIILTIHGVSSRAFQMAFLGEEGLGKELPDWYQDSDNPGNCDICLIEGDLENGFKTSLIHESKKRGPSTPKDYKTAPHGESLARSA